MNVPTQTVHLWTSICVALLQCHRENGGIFLRWVALNNQPHTKPFKKKKCVFYWVYLPASVCQAQHPKRTIFTLPNSDVYDSPGSVMVAFDQAVVPGMDNRTVELIKWLGMHVSYVTRGPGPPGGYLKGTAMFGNESGISWWRWNLMPFKARLLKNEAKNGVHEV